jgi:hypothetical protein
VFTDVHLSFYISVFISALFGRISGLYGPTDLSGNTRDSLPTESEDTSYSFSPVLTNPCSIENVFADFDSDFLPPG